MNNRLVLVQSSLERMDGIEICRDFSESSQNGIISGKISLSEAGHELEFDVIIYPQYPLQLHDSETIRFINSEYLDYDHVNADGSICIHTNHNPRLAQKLHADISSLREWIHRYYIKKLVDLHYEHIIVSGNQESDTSSCFLFTDVGFSFRKHSFGIFNYSLLAKGEHRSKLINTCIVQNFKTEKALYECKWNNFYRCLPSNQGLFVFIEQQPVNMRRFIVDTWNQLEKHVTQDFLKFLYIVQKNKASRKDILPQLPLLIGYKLPNDELHWQCALIDTNSFPNESIKLKNGFGGRLKNLPIKWSSTKNCSYQYFFGRGKLSDEITEKKILILGIGAIGSIVATTLTRGGCKHLSLVDYDIKEPENVCRSEYNFYSGITSKITDLSNNLVSISPFIEISYGDTLTDFLKFYTVNNSIPDKLRDLLEEYDIIIDCSADDDLIYILDSLNLKNELISFSITNCARELICAVNSGSYDLLMAKDKFIQNTIEPLYQPTGCWSPTFSASYNDINTLVQFAIKHINNTFNQGKVLRHFCLSTESANEFNIKLKQF